MIECNNLRVQAVNSTGKSGFLAFSNEALPRTCSGVVAGSREDNASEQNLQNKNPKPGADSIGSDQALGTRHCIVQ